MMTHEHHTQQQLVLHAMQELPHEEATSIQNHLHTCSTCRNEFADVCCELALFGEVLEPREVPDGARLRFVQKVAKVASIHAGSEHRNHVGSSPVTTEVHAPVGIQKKSLLPMNALPSKVKRNNANPNSRVVTAAVAASRMVAARISSIF